MTSNGEQSISQSMLCNIKEYIDNNKSPDRNVAKALSMLA